MSYSEKLFAIYVIVATYPNQISFLVIFATVKPTYFYNLTYLCIRYCTTLYIWKSSKVTKVISSSFKFKATPKNHFLKNYVSVGFNLQNIVNILVFRDVIRGYDAPLTVAIRIVSISGMEYRLKYFVHDHIHKNYGVNIPKKP